MSSIQSLAGGIILVALLCSLLLAPQASARYYQLLQEGWERPVGTPFPWSTNGHMWGLFPNPPSLTNPRWDIERNAIYHSTGFPEDVTAVWCVGSNDQLIAGVDYYLPNVYTHLYWGPFSIAEAAQNEYGEAFGSFWIWAEMESNLNGTGDFFYLGVRSGGFNPNITAWDFLHMDDQGGNNMEWTQAMFNFDEVYTLNGDTISYIDQGIVDNLYISLIFDSDYNENDYFGVFIDDISMGYDDGMYDFDYRDYELFNPDNPDEEYEFLYVNLPVQLRTKFKSHGNLMSNEVDHLLYDGQNQVLSQITGQWQGGTVPISYEEAFPEIFTPQVEGELTFTIWLDGEMEQVESDENNNFETFTIPVYAENTPPAIEWINPPEGGIWNQDEVFDIIYYATNSPVEESARLSLYYDYDDEGFDGYPVTGGINLPITNTIDTLSWHIGALPDYDYYLYAKLEDDYYDPIYVYADGILEVESSSPVVVPEEFQITSVYPNPFNPTVEVTMDLPAPGDVRAVWYSVDGRQVDTQKLGKLSAGSQQFAWTPTNLPSGVYLLRLETPFGIGTQKVTYLK